jgi:hypothetical protein
MSTKPPTEHQHYVPQFYLRAFADPSIEKLHTLDFDLLKVINPQVTRPLCWEPFFYGVQTGQADDTSQVIEDYLGDLETAFAHDLPPIIESIRDPNRHIFDAEKRVIASLMSMMWLRGPQAREVIAQQRDISLDYEARVVDDIREHLPPGTRLKYDPPTRDNTWHLHALTKSIGDYARKFHAQHWNVLVSRGAGTFVTTCEPIATETPEYEGRNVPSLQRRTHYFSLTPEICIHAVRPYRLGKRLRRRTLFAGDEEVVTETNRIIASRAVRYVYAREQQPLDSLLRAFGASSVKPTTT